MISRKPDRSSLITSRILSWISNSLDPLDHAAFSVLAFKYEKHCGLCLPSKLSLQPSLHIYLEE